MSECCFCFLFIQVDHGSLVENKLLSSEECKDVFYDFDVFVTYSEDVRNKEALDSINKALSDRKLNVLLEKDCLGKHWLTKLKYAATKCRWVVFFETKGSKSKSFMSSQAVYSLKSILESRKVQSVAIVNKRDELHIHDDLRWVTYIPYNDKEKDMIEMLHTVVSGKFYCFTFVRCMLNLGSCILKILTDALSIHYF